MKLLWVPFLLLLPALGQSASPPDPPSSTATVTRTDVIPIYQPITLTGRLQWFAVETAGPVSLLGTGPISSGWGTLLDRPKEYGTHWEGFGQRYGIRLTGISTGNAIEAGLGSVWGEDPRYFPSHLRGFRARAGYVIKTSFLAPHRDGQWHPAYARYVGVVGNNILSVTWRVPSERNTSNTLQRCAYGVLVDIVGNAFTEFWPDVKRKVFGK
jgi:hypothetical protein